MNRSFVVLLLLATPCCGAERAIDKEVVVNAGVSDVWKAWTTRDGLKTFFAPDANVELRVDGAFEMFFNPYAKPGMKGADGLKIIGFQENTFLSFTWNAPPSLPEVRKQRSIVIVRLAPQGEGKTRVTVHHIGFGEGGEWDRAFEYFSKAWPYVLGNLQRRFAQGPIDWTEQLDQLKKKGKS